MFPSMSRKIWSLINYGLQSVRTLYFLTKNNEGNIFKIKKNIERNWIGAEETCINANNYDVTICLKTLWELLKQMFNNLSLKNFYFKDSVNLSFI